MPATSIPAIILIPSSETSMSSWKTVVDHTAYQQAQKNAKVIEAKILAFVNKVRVENTTALTQVMLDRVDTEIKQVTVNMRDLPQRQRELETTIAKQQEEFNTYVKS